MSVLPLAAAARCREHQVMFSVHCSGHGSEVLLFPRDIERLVNTTDGIELHWRCRCGTTGTLLTGRNRRTGGSAGPDVVAGVVAAR